jgi:OmpA-OmpF porin, OOP family
MDKRLALNGLAIVGLAFGAAAYAEEAPGFYAGASVGQSSVEVSEVDFDGSDTAFKIFGGYAFNQNFALELAWFDAGSPDEAVAPGAAVAVDLSGLNASAVGRLPLGDVFALFGKIGFASYDAEVSGRVNGSTIFSEDASDEDLTYGIGGEFRFGQTFGLRAEYEIVDVSDADFNFLSVGGVFRF